MRANQLKALTAKTEVPEGEEIWYQDSNIEILLGFQMLESGKEYQLLIDPLA